MDGGKDGEGKVMESTCFVFCSHLGHETVSKPAFFQLHQFIFELIESKESEVHKNRIAANKNKTIELV